MSSTTSVISGSITTGITLDSGTYGNPLTVTGTINVAGGPAIYYQGGTGTNWTIKSSGVIGGTASQGIALGTSGTTVASGSVTNQTGGSIYGSSAGVYINGSGFVTNTNGTISSNGKGVDLLQAGTVSNQGTGVISGSAYAVYIYGYGAAGNQPDVLITNAGTLIGNSGLEELLGGSVTNLSTGKILGQGQNGVYLDGAGTVTNSGLITGNSSGIVLYEGGTIINNPGATISGSDGILAIGGTVINAGTVGGNIYALNFQSSGGTYYPSLLRVDPGAVFNGNISGGQGTLELASGSSAGSLSGVGSAITNFKTLTFDAGARWTFADDVNGLTAFSMISGLQGGNTIDLTDYAANQLSVSGGHLVLSGTNGSPVTLHVPTTLTSSSFYIAYDGASGTDITGVQTASWIGGNADWNTPSDWSTNGVPTAIDTAIIGNAGFNTVTIASGESFAITNATLSAGNILEVDGTLTPSGTVSVASGHIDLTGTINGGIIADTTGSGLISGMGALDGVTYRGTLNVVTTNEQLNILNGLTATGAGGAGAGTINFTANNGTLSFGNVSPLNDATGQTLDNVTLNIGNATGADVLAPTFSGGTFTIGSGTTIDHSGAGALAELYGGVNTTVVFNGTLSDIAAGGDFTITGDASSVFNNNGTIVVTNGDALTVASAIAAGSGNGVITDAFGAVANFATSVAADQTFDFTDSTGTLKLQDPSDFAAAIQGFRAGDTIELVGIAADTVGWVSGKLVINDGLVPVAALSMPANYTGYTFVPQQSGGNTFITVTGTCFGPGTRILTPRGDVAVEDLRVGDLVMTISGSAQPIRWIGSRRVNFRRHPNRQRALPVRILAHAFGHDRPRRDMVLSPDHAVFVENVLIPVRHLINGTTIAQTEMDRITYYHVELPRHDVLLAEGLPAESYLEAGDRDAFTGAGSVVQLHPQFGPESEHYAALWEAEGYAPLVVSGPQVERARARLLAVAVEGRAA